MSSSFLITGESRTGGGFRVDSLFKTGLGEETCEDEALELSAADYYYSAFSTLSIVFYSLIYNSLAFIFSSYSLTLISNSYTIYFYFSSSISLSLILYDLPSSLFSTFSTFSIMSLFIPNLFLLGLDSLGTWR